MVNNYYKINIGRCGCETTRKCSCINSDGVEKFFFFDMAAGPAVEYLTRNAAINYAAELHGAVNKGGRKGYYPVRVSVARPIPWGVLGNIPVIGVNPK